MNLTIDIGNTRAKIILFEGALPVYEEIVSEGLDKCLAKIIARFHPQCCAWCNVGSKEELTTQMMDSLPCFTIRLTGMTNVPLNVCYKSRHTLGADRLAAVLGATALCPETDLLIIDAGTCITYDLVDAQGNYFGGNISPGMEMRFKALHHYTARLPKIEEEGELPGIGVDTETAIRCGVVQGLTFEIEGYVRLLKKKYPQLRIFLTGGSHFDFSEDFKKELLTDRYLVARGLNRLLPA